LKLTQVDDTLSRPDICSRISTTTCNVEPCKILH
jgi:hypothetical protein